MHTNWQGKEKLLKGNKIGQNFFYNIEQIKKELAALQTTSMNNLPDHFRWSQLDRLKNHLETKPY